MKYINLVIDNKSDSTDNFFTYGCREEVSIGSKVYVPFARSKKLREGYVVSYAEDIDQDLMGRIKYVDSVDEEVILSEEAVRTAIWMRDRCLCKYIDAINCFTPVGHKAKRGERKNPVGDMEGEVQVIDNLTDEQVKVLAPIRKAIQEKAHDRFLLHGVTGSGKTEVYIRATEECVKLGRKVIILVPEISLTTQMIDRFIGRFGKDSIAVLHSKLSVGERYDQWQRIRSPQTQIVIGARSAIFAPLENIGLIVIDEEHESTYKSDYTPKYDTIEVAIKRLNDRDNQGVLLMGSATPSVVTYSRAKEGIYKLLTLKERYNKVTLPKVDIVDMRRELREGNVSIISRALYSRMIQTLESGKQVILFLNRRGYSTFISCRECGYVATCPKCGLSLTYHKGSDRLTCHYCGYEERTSSTCPECGSKYVKYFGSGTEKVEEIIDEMFPDYKVARVDLDSVKNKGALTKKIRDFRDGKTHILVGTQIIAKGLDFRNVGLVGIISADIILNIPDFRSPERTFQLITQAAGRAGRGDETGQVIIQTYDTEHYCITSAAAQDYERFYEQEISMRRFMKYPPYSDMFQLLFKSEDKETAREGAEDWYDRFRNKLGPEEANNVLRPQEAFKSKINDKYQYTMLIKCPKGKRRLYAAVILQIKEENKGNKKAKKYTVGADVNPYSFE